VLQTSEGQYRSKPAVRYSERPDYGGYSLESYSQHITRMRQVFERERLRNRLAWVARQLTEQEGEWKLSDGLLERAMLLTFALHDLGKLDVRWQKWAKEYQDFIDEGSQDFLIAHTHWDESNPKHKEAQKRIKAKKPKTHAGEGADAGAHVLWEALNGKENPGLYKAAFTAIARHHSPFLEGANPYSLHANAEATLSETLVAIGDQTWQDWAKLLRDSPNEEPNVQKRLLEPYPDASLIWW
jgi:CRISPR-associated endonuclease/helicase Cas3